MKDYVGFDDYAANHRCTCEGGPEHPCLDPQECWTYYKERLQEEREIRNT